MLTEQNIKLFQKLGLPIYDEDADEKDVPFTDLLEEKTKEEIYSAVPRSCNDVASRWEQGRTRCLRSSSGATSLARKGAGGLNTRACAVSTWSSRLGLLNGKAGILRRFPTVPRTRSLLSAAPFGASKPFCPLACTCLA